MIAYKFLRAGRAGPFSGHVWPAPNGGPGEWVRTDGPVEPCRRAVHACRVRDLPHWITDELWEVELGGDVVEHPTKLVAPAGRLVARVEAWSEDAALELRAACAFRAREHAVRALGGPRREAAALAAASTLPEIEVEAARLEAEGSAAARVAAGYARDTTNMSKWPAATCFIAAEAAAHAGGLDALAAERAWQAAWLADRLGLSAAS